MSNEPLGNTTRRGFLGTATAATALTLAASPAAEAQTAPSQIRRSPSGAIERSAALAADRRRYRRLDKAGRNGDPQRGILQTGARPLWSGLSKNSRELRLYSHRQG